MSSIYQKSRDGYYYYQAYLYNPKSKKKDKRVFHSLGTKNIKEAKKKKDQLDLKYNKPILTKYTSPIKLSVGSVFFIFIATVAVTIFFMSLFISFSTNNKNESINNNIINSSIDSTQKNSKNHNDIIILRSDLAADSILEKLKSGIKHAPSSLRLAKFNLMRIESLDDSFNQGRIHITINKDVNEEEQLFLCRKLSKRYDQFSNIIICIYSDDSVGNDLAQGNDLNISNKEKKQSWMALYSFNPVEGEYFDNNPAVYLGIY